MLWYKGWLETRFRVLFALVVWAYVLISAISRGVAGHAGPKEFLLAPFVIWLLVPIMLAGAGIHTQPAFRAVKGLHGSMLFTLSLPVSRLKLLAVRAGLGWIESASLIVLVCACLWTLFPQLRQAEFIEYVGVLLACMTPIYCITVLLATVLDDIWRLYGSGIAIGLLWALFSKTPFPRSLNIFRAMGVGSPLMAHSVPWGAVALSLSLAAALFFAAVKIVQTREY
ncbi:MAG TPA: hypothetical protein VG675_02210 [Bryobacteraceae bacterium]|nr:hypothetical protein [Bryobacteraceae bacterium]